MDLNLSEDQAMLADLISRLCADVFTPADLRAAEVSGAGFSQVLWGQLRAQGLCGLAAPAEHGGLGLGAFETALAYEQLGRALAVTPHFTSCVLAARLVEALGTAEQIERWLPALAAGEAWISVAAIEPGGGFGRAGVRCRAEATADGLRLTGRKHFAPFADGAARLIVLARDAHDEIRAALVDPQGPGVRLVRQRELAGEPHFVVDLDAAPAEALSASEVWGAWLEALLRGQVALAAQAVGAADQAHAIGVAYAKQREAFGRPIGGFQAVAHALAEVAVGVKGARALVWQAAWAIDAGRAWPRLAAMARLKAGEVFRRAAATAVQVHGGLGYTTACDAQLFFRRSKAWAALNGDAAFLEGEIADLTLGPVPARETADV
ncbi:MAG: acyl-CoA/acyl-ACP dehydrogenase [Caulobacteraceae bacterium]|nr:acyl-CoA/acyl-ACP dehydrogenase [Caulobacteraceae bacterium]